MMRFFCGGLCFLLVVALGVGSRLAFSEEVKVQPTVILLHGLARSAKSMKKMEKALMSAGFKVCNVDYPSTKYRIESLIDRFILPKIRHCVGKPGLVLHFVTHSMGGILVRYLNEVKKTFEIGRVVMLSPPNQGSEVVDKLGDWWLFKKINGPAGNQLSTAQDSAPNRLGKADFELGILTGDRSINWILSGLIPGDDDGKVSVVRAQLEGMDDFMVVHATHPFIMKNKTAIAQTLAFLKYGRFARNTD